MAIYAHPRCNVFSFTMPVKFIPILLLVSFISFGEENTPNETIEKSQTSKSVPLSPIYRVSGKVVAADTVNRRLIVEVDKKQDTLYIEATTKLIRGVKKQPLSGFAPREEVTCSYEIRQGRKFALQISTRHTSISSPLRPNHPLIKRPLVSEVKPKK